jgi:lipopolysaccharide transport system ATP-binding protein
MSDTVISVENVSKAYRLGQIGGGTLKEDVSRWWAKLQGKPDPTLKIGQEHHARLIGEQFWALDNVSFEVKQGEVLGIIGRNGAGKSTLLKILSQVTTPTSGEIKVRGRIASLLEVGTGFHPELTGRENIFLNGAILGMTKAEIRKKFDEIVAFSEIEEFIDTPVKRYSSGMYVRLAFAVAAHLEPEILICDEVLAVGDAQFQKKCVGKMQDVSNEGRTVLFVSHNMSAVRSLCKKGMILQGGNLLDIGNVEKIIDLYLANSLDATSVVMDLENVSRSDGLGSRLKITRVVFNEGKDIRHGQPLRIDLHFKVFATVEAVSFGAGFCNRDGVRLLSIDTDVPGERIRIAAGQSGVVCIKIPVFHMEPDFYNIYVGARSGDNFSLDYAPGCGSVIVIPSELTPPVIAMRESGRGGFRQPNDWTIQCSG